MKVVVTVGYTSDDLIGDVRECPPVERTVKRTSAVEPPSVGTVNEAVLWNGQYRTKPSYKVTRMSLFIL